MHSIKEILEKTGAILEGHFLLTSGLHSDKYFQMSLVFQYPDYGEIICKKLAESFKSKKIDIVIGPAIGGIIISYQLAKILGSKSIFTERENEKMKLRRGFKIEKGENVLICEDVITTGGSVKEVIEIVEKEGGKIEGIACIVRRGKVNFSYPLKSLIDSDVKNYLPDECPLCKSNIPIVKPGSRKSINQDFVK